MELVQLAMSVPTSLKTTRIAALVSSITPVTGRGVNPLSHGGVATGGECAELVEEAGIATWVPSITPVTGRRVSPPSIESGATGDECVELAVNTGIAA